MAIEIAAIVDRMQTAGRSWESALDAHALAPPDAGFPGRLRQLSDAAAEQAGAFQLAADGGLGWRARAIEDGFTLAPELTPGMNRPGSAALWKRFDEAVEVLAAALAGSSPAALASAFSDLSDASRMLTDELEDIYSTGDVARGTA
ncbi:MAG: hypothetical protein WAU75_20670 [Solirubrobacteraceae bacterium]